MVAAAFIAEGGDMNIEREDEIALRQFARFLLRHTIVHVEAERADEWQRLFARAMSVLGAGAMGRLFSVRTSASIAPRLIRLERLRRRRTDLDRSVVELEPSC